MFEPWWSVMSRVASVTMAPVLQVAADGRWETAAAVPVAGSPAAVRTVVEQVARAARVDIAVEIMWPAQAFVGVCWPADGWERAAAAASRGVAVLTSGSPVPPSQTVEAALLALLGTTPGTDLELVELGAVNAWHSIGPEQLWRRRAVLTEQAVESVLVRRPDLANCSHPVAVELAVTDPQPCWVGIHVSTGTGPIHRLDRELLTKVLGEIGTEVRRC